MIPKYRVWVEAEETMHPVLGLDWSGVGDDLTVFVPMGKTSLRAVSIDGAVLMQSTGLFDVNGKEIFEGDVVRMHSGELLPVRLHHGMFGPVCYYASSVFEKVGNIFENPELTEHPDFREATND
ncbi:TPA: YopX family protein [Streptococcus suis]